MVLVLNCSPRVAVICLAEKGGGFAAPTITLMRRTCRRAKIESHIITFQFRALFIYVIAGKLGVFNSRMSNRFCLDLKFSVKPEKHLKRLATDKVRESHFDLSELTASF